MTCQICYGDQNIIKDAWKSISIAVGELFGGTTFSDESLNEHAARPTAPSPNQDGFSDRNDRHNGIISERCHLDLFRIFQERW